jgi:hypothetical protein
MNPIPARPAGARQGGVGCEGGGGLEGTRRGRGCGGECGGVAALVPQDREEAAQVGSGSKPVVYSAVQVQLTRPRGCGVRVFEYGGSRNLFRLDDWTTPVLSSCVYSNLPKEKEVEANQRIPTHVHTENTAFVEQQKIRKRG